MKTETMNISLPEELADFLRQDMSASSFANTSEYVRDLIRQRRQSQVAQDVALLQEAGAAAPAGPSPEVLEDILATQKRARARRRAAR